MILSTGAMPCSVGSGPPPPPPGGPGYGPPPGGPGPGYGPPPGGEGSGPATGGPDQGAPGFNAGFLNRVWKFHVVIDSASEGRLSVTLERVLNLPKRLADQDDELLDQDAIVLIGSGLRVFRGTQRVPLSELGDAEEARIQGKLLPPAKWANDEDEQPVPTIRAKKAFLAP